MNTWKVILATLVIFGASVITSGLLVSFSNSVQRHPRRQAAAEDKRSVPKSNTNNAPRDFRVPLPPNLILRKDFLERLERDLKLTLEQRGRIEKIIGEGQDRIKGLGQKIEPQVREELAETREKIRAELTTEQQSLFTDFFRRKPSAAHDHAATNSPAQPSATNFAPAGKSN